ncbi:enoyl-CoA hydratase-related protein [Streptomyces sp. NPDC097610]|uniref:enoyl-CoA hydratase/isomerase family protein n=1 Tax=Streptomyces sp. NPDC097610 TaxID=3157227 RepID=UPI0033242F2B
MDDIEVRVDGAACFIQIARPEVRNALRGQTMLELTAALSDFDADPTLRAAVITGAGGVAFSSGADLRELSARKTGGTATAPRARPAVASPELFSGFRAFETVGKPVIAAVDGYCLAAGFELALLCDIRLSTTTSVFGLPEPRRSLLAGPGLVQLSRLMPMGEALRLQLTGTTMTAERAHQVGLVSELHPDQASLMVGARRIVAEIEACAPLAVEYIKRIVRDGHDQPVVEQWRMAELYSTIIAGTEDAVEGPKAFLERRAPTWSGR